MKLIPLLFCLLVFAPARAQKPSFPATIQGRFVYLDGSSVVSRSGLLFVGYSRRDQSGRGFTCALGFPLYPQTIVIGAHQTYCLGLDFGYIFKSHKLGTKGFIGFEPRGLLMARAEEDRFDEYKSGDSLYPYDYARIHSVRYGFNPTVVYSRCLSGSFMVELSAGLQCFFEKVSYTHVFNAYRHPRLSEGRSDKLNHAGWNTSFREFLGMRVLYKFN